MLEIVKIKGVGPASAAIFAENGYGSIKKIAKAVVTELATIPGVGEVRAKQLIDSAKLLLVDAPPSKAVVLANGGTDPGKKKKKKTKKAKGKNKKDRKNKKKKKKNKNKKNS